MVHSFIAEQLKSVEACLACYESFMRTATSDTADNTTLRKLSEDVHQAENAADRSLRQMIESLRSSPYLPSTRSELIQVAAQCDHIANKCEHIAQMMALRQFRFPTYCREAVMEILSLTHAQYALLQTTISKLFSHLNELLEDHAVLDDIRGYESRVDEIEKKLFEEIYAKEELRLSERMLIAEFVEWVCDVSDVIENIADQIQIMLITREA